MSCEIVGALRAVSEVDVRVPGLHVGVGAFRRVGTGANTLTDAGLSLLPNCERLGGFAELIRTVVVLTRTVTAVISCEVVWTLR